MPLNSFWTEIDPLNDCTVSVTGGELTIAIPSGTTHDIYTGVNTGPRVVQLCGNVDFDIETKVTSQPVTANQVAGLIAQEDLNNLVRWDVYWNGTQMRVFAGFLINGNMTVVWNSTLTSPTFPLWLRLVRAGNQWSFYRSYNGTAWTLHGSTTFTQLFNISSVGLCALTGGTNPAWTGTFDYFRDNLAPEASILPYTIHESRSLDLYTDTHILSEETTDISTVSDEYVMTYIPADTPLLIEEEITQSMIRADTFEDHLIKASATTWINKDLSTGSWSNK